MTRILLFSVVAACLAGVATSDLSAQNKAGATKAKNATNEQYAYLATLSETNGVVQGTGPGSITVRVLYTHVGTTGTPMRGRPAQLTMLKEYLDFELPLTEKATFRKTKLGVEYDEKGNVKEGAAAKGSDGFYPATFEDVTKGDEVRILLSRPSATAPKTPKKDENGAVVGLPGNRPRVRTVIITKDATPAAMPDRKGKK